MRKKNEPNEIILHEGKYQFCPPCSPEEDARLEASIAATWKASTFPDVPLYVDLGNYILDGHRRYRAYRRLGIRNFSVRKIDVRGLGDEELRFLVNTLNANRRQENLVNRRQRWAAIDRFLLLDPWASNRQVAEHFEIDKNTVERRRRHLEATGATAPVPRRRGGPRRTRIITTQSVREFLQVCEDIDMVGEIVGNLRRQKEEATYARRRKEAEEGRRIRIDSNYPMLCCRFQNLLRKRPDLKGAAALVLADLPWAKKFLHLYEPLAETILDLLIPGRAAAIWPGKRHIDRSLPILSKYLTFVQQSGYSHASFETMRPTGRGIYVLGRCTWYAVYIKGDRFEWDGKGPALMDWRPGHGMAKEQHPWGIHSKDVADVICTFTKPGELVVDLTGGSFSAAVACRHLKRRYVGCNSDRDAVSVARKWLHDINGGLKEDPMQGWVQPDLRDDKAK